MPRTAPGLRADPRTRLTRLRRDRPEWRAWFQLLDQAERALASGAWDTPLVGSEPAPPDASGEAPLLHRRTLRIDAGAAERLVHRLGSAAAGGGLAGGESLRGYRPSADQAVALILAAVRQDRTRLAAMANSSGVEPGALTSVAHFAALPLLRSCGRLLAGSVPAHWPQGYCPVCAAWPILAERRGLDRSRRLRCGRCAGEWPVQWLCCAYCGEREHERLGSLVPEDGKDTLKVETCAGCGGYLKSVATLQAIPSSDLLLRDLETVELDLVALERGYRRPEENGFRLEAEPV